MKQTPSSEKAFNPFARTTCVQGCDHITNPSFYSEDARSGVGGSRCRLVCKI